MMKKLQPLFNLVPKFMKTFQMKVFLLGGSGVTGYLYYQQRNELKMDHPLVGEAIRLLESKKDVRELIGAPLYVVQGISNRASIGDQVASFSYKVKGPRGTLNIELSGVAQPLSNIGLTREAKDYLRKNKLETETTDRASLDEVNYLDYNIPEKAYFEKLRSLHVSTQFDDETARETRASDNLPSGLKFWKIDYLYCNVDENMRIMVHPDKETRAKLNQPTNFILKRENLDHLAQEKKAKLVALNLYKADMSQEE
jgi:hypothetical protein